MMSRESILETRLEIAKRQVKALRARNVILTRSNIALRGHNTKYRRAVESLLEQNVRLRLNQKGWFGGQLKPWWAFWR